MHSHTHAHARSHAHAHAHTHQRTHCGVTGRDAGRLQSHDLWIEAHLLVFLPMAVLALFTAVVRVPAAVVLGLLAAVGTLEGMGTWVTLCGPYVGHMLAICRSHVGHM